MRLHIVAVGKLKAGPHAALARHYAERLAWPLAIREVEEKRPLPAAELREREGALWRDSGTADLAFLIGGADGLAEGLRQKAQLVLSLGAMTWPHLLVRGMLLEQLYRAQQILAGHPYHRG